MKYLAAITLLVIGGLMVACDRNLGMNGLTPRQYSAPLEIKKLDIDATFQFVRSADEATAICTAKGKRAPAPGSYTTGCAVRPNSPHNSTARWLIVAVKPVSWNDTPSLANGFHEVLHGLDAEHE